MIPLQIKFDLIIDKNYKIANNVLVSILKAF